MKKPAKSKKAKSQVDHDPKRIKKLLARLEKLYPDAKCALIHENPLQLLIATILSAQCTDKRVNMVTPELFARYPDAKAFSEAKIEDLEQMIRSTGFYHNKAVNIQKCCRAIVEKHGGRLDYLTQLNRGTTFRLVLPIEHS